MFTTKFEKSFYGWSSLQKHPKFEKQIGKNPMS
jgi:hypothetical protein